MGELLVRKLVLVAVVIMIILVAAVAAYLMYYAGGRAPSNVDDLISKVSRTFILLSTAFENEEKIPRKYTCDGEDLSPPLTWSGAPPGTQSYALIVYDPDAPKGIFYHWLLYNIPPDLTSLPEGVPKGGETPYGLQGINDFGALGYGGPCPPPGSTHHYVFILLALDTKLGIGAGAAISDLLKALDGHVLAYAKLVGIYSR